MLKNINFFIASHHGHESGFTPAIIDYTGKANLFIISANRGDKLIFFIN